MFRPEVRKTPTRSAFGMLELIFHAAVRSVRKSHGNAVIGLLMNILQTVLLIAIMFFVMNLLGGIRSKVRGDFLLFVMSGVFMFMTHTKTLAAVSGADGPTSAIMKHSPMNSIISIASAALGALYLQALSAFFVLYFYHAAIQPITIHEPVGMVAMFLLSWASGAAIGMIFLALKPWNPPVVGLISMVYQRANMIASGKMLVANATPTSILSIFDWNPLFHTIDQGRGFIFLNYHPRYSNYEYPIIVTIACVLIGLMGEYYTRKHASISWGAGK
jgi:ABC-type polysaccharide/polyol phosphate export permease